MSARSKKATPRMSIEVAGLSDMGQSRSNNEDAAFWEVSGSDSRDALLIIADGVGGAAAGEVASQEAVAQCRSSLAGALSAPALADRLSDAVQQANERVYALAQTDDRYRGMATTLVVGAIREAQLYVAHVGDSRCYIVRDGQATQITADHTWVAEEVKNGRLAQEEAAQHPQRNVISRGVGINASVKVDTTGPIELRSGDIVTLCTDGLSDVVHDDEIAGVASTFAPEEASTRLIDLANSRGGPDNVSVIIARLRGNPATRLAGTREAPALPQSPVPAPTTSDPPPNHRRTPAGTRSTPLAAAGIAAGLIAVVLAATFVLVRGGDGDSTVAGLGPSPNGQGVVAAVTPTPGPTCAHDGTPAWVYTAVQGDNVEKIAKTYLDEGTLEERKQGIVACDDKIDSSNLNDITTDQKIRVPCESESACPPSTATPPR